MGQTEQLLDLTQSLSLLIESGLTVHEAIKINAALPRKKSIFDLMNRVSWRLERGDSFSLAIEEEPLFPPLYRGLVRIGEKTGRLPQVLQQLSVYLENSRKVSQKLNSAMIYPAILLLLIIGGVGALVFLLIPRLRGELAFDERVSAQLELILGRAETVMLIFAFFCFMALIVPLLYRLLRRRDNRGALFYHRLLLSLPVIGRLIGKREMLNLFFSLSLTTECRIPLNESLSLAKLVTANLHIRSRIENVRCQLVKGESLSALFMRDPVFPHEVGRWTAIGERVGKTDSVFGQLKAYYAREVEKTSERVINLIEPAASLFIGGVLISIVLLLIVPLMTLYGGLL